MAMKILIAEDDDDLRNLMVFRLENELNIKVFEANSGKTAIQQLIQNADLNCILCDYDMPDGNGGMVFNYAKTHFPKVAYILCSSATPDDHPEYLGHRLAGHLEKPFRIESAIRLLKDLAHQLQISIEGESAHYFRVRAQLLYRLNILSVDLYLKISDHRYLKLMGRNTNLEPSDIQRLKQKNVEYFYIKEADSKFFLEKLEEGMKKIYIIPSSEDPTVYEIATAAHELAQDLILKMGINSETKSLIHSAVNLALRTIRNIPSLYELFKHPEEDPQNYIASHSVMLSYLAPSLAALVGLKSEKTFLNFALAAFLHDITLTHQKLARLSSIRELQSQASLFSPEEIRAFELHPQEAAKWAAHLSHSPEEIESIIWQHHESPDGRGFPRQLMNQEIGFLSTIFIISEKLTQKMSRKSENLKRALEELLEIYPYENFKQVISAALSSLK